MMLKSLVVLAIAGTMSVPAAAQTTPSAPATNQAQPAQPQMVKKRVCEDSNDDPTSRIHNRVCRTIMVPAPPSASGQQAQAPANQPNSGN
jgi:hypothetical protein